MRLIDADDLLKKIKWWLHKIVDNYGKNDEYAKCLSSVITRVGKEPSIDAVPVVRCKDCKHRINEGSANSICGLDVPIFDIYGYCSDGERKDDV